MSRRWWDIEIERDNERETKWNFFLIRFFCFYVHKYQWSFLLLLTPSSVLLFFLFLLTLKNVRGWDWRKKKGSTFELLLSFLLVTEGRIKSWKVYWYFLLTFFLSLLLSPKEWKEKEETVKGGKNERRKNWEREETREEESWRRRVEGGEESGLVREQGRERKKMKEWERKEERDERKREGWSLSPTCNSCCRWTKEGRWNRKKERKGEEMMKVIIIKRMRMQRWGRRGREWRKKERE